VNRNWNNWNRDRNDWDRDRNDWDRNDWNRYWSRNGWANPYAGSNWRSPNYWNRYYSNGHFGSPFFGYGGYNRYPSYGYGGYGLGGWLPGIGIGLGIGRLFGGGYGGYGGYGYGGYGRGYGYPGYYDGNYYTGYRGDYVDNSTTVVQEQPVEVEAPADGNFLASARSAFESGEYERAQRFANHAVIDDPQNAKAHEMIALAMFAQGNFAGSAEATHATVALGSLADWPTLYGYYNDRGKYEEHFNALKQFAAEKPQAPEGQFLLGAHHLMMGHQDSARDAFSTYLKLVDHQDPIGIQLYGQAGGNVDALPKPTSPPPGAAGATEAPEDQRPTPEGTEG
jgi:tetratricopeptide (TPR) repeat protein